MRRAPGIRRLMWLPACFALLACAGASSVPAQTPASASRLPGISGDTLDPNWVPVGFGTLRQDDIALKTSPSSGLQVRAIPWTSDSSGYCLPIRIGHCVSW